jgi:hypothetical protein
VPRPKKISDFKPLFTNLAQSSHYQVYFGGLSKELTSYLGKRGVDSRFIGESAGLLCSSASIPGSSLATADVAGNFMGVAEKFVHTRIFTQLDLEFYVDSEYKMIKFLEHWMEYATSGSGVSETEDGYFYRMRYPYEDKNRKNGGYKCNQTKIVKFDRDYKNEIEYTFIGMFPINLSSTPVSYEGSQALKVSASFNFERYIPGKTSSKSVAQKTNNNKGESSQGSQEPNDRFLGPPKERGLNSQQTLDELYRAGREGRIKSATEFIGPLQ